MVNVLDEVKKEKTKDTKYKDEGILADMQCASFSTSLREIDAFSDEDVKKQKDEANLWLCSKASNVPALMMDNITKIVAPGKKSADAFLYHCLDKEKNSYLIEFKCVSKKKLFDEYLKTNSSDSIVEKFKDSAYLIKNELTFGGAYEGEELVKKTHTIIVYDGKNDMATSVGPRVPRGKKVTTEKQINERFSCFATAVKGIGYGNCTVDELPGNAIPEAKKLKGCGKVRDYSIFSAKDFSEMIEAGLFDDWDWGGYTI